MKSVVSTKYLAVWVCSKILKKLINFKEKVLQKNILGKAISLSIRNDSDFYQKQHYPSLNISSCPDIWKEDLNKVFVKPAKGKNFVKILRKF